MGTDWDNWESDGDRLRQRCVWTTDYRFRLRQWWAQTGTDWTSAGWMRTAVTSGKHTVCNDCTMSGTQGSWWKLWTNCGSEAETVVNKDLNGRIRRTHNTFKGFVVNWALQGGSGTCVCSIECINPSLVPGWLNRVEQSSSSSSGGGGGSSDRIDPDTASLLADYSRTPGGLTVALNGRSLLSTGRCERLRAAARGGLSQTHDSQLQLRGEARHGIPAEVGTHTHTAAAASC